MLAMLLFFSVILITKVTYAAAAQPNLLFVLLDDHSTIDEGLDVMPNYAARFVTEGMRMSNAFAASPKCCPSRTSLLSFRQIYTSFKRRNVWVVWRLQFCRTL